MITSAANIETILAFKLSPTENENAAHPKNKFKKEKVQDQIRRNFWNCSSAMHKMNSY